MYKKVNYISIIILSFLIFPTNMNGQDNNYITLSVGKFDFNKKVKESTFGQVEFRSAKKILFLNPITGILVNGDKGFFVFAGISMDIHLGSFLVLTPSFAPGYYNKGNSKDLFLVLEFRSKLELAVKFLNDMRLGVSFSHISNASLGPPNPGVENISFNFSIPF